MQTLTLTSRRDIASALYELRFTRPKDWCYEPGQFARIGLGVEGGEPVFRAYSIAGSPAEDELVFLIKRVTDGQLSPRLCDLKPGDEVLLDGDAQGNLLPARIPGGDTMWMMATGSGLAPFVAMLNDGRALSAWAQRVLVIGARTREETDGLAAYARARTTVDVDILTAVSRDEGPLRGRLPALIESGDLEASAGSTITADASRVLLCGNPDFIRDTRALFKARGIVSPRFGKPGQLLVESLW